MFRKQRQPAPYFRMPGAPYNPATGERAPLGRYSTKGTTLATFQVIGDDPTDFTTADDHDNYIVCRGFEPDADPNFRYLHDPYTAEDSTPINVAKPYAIRGRRQYKRGQIVIAARIRTGIGYNQGVASLTLGQPSSLDETLGILLDDEGVAISWLDIGTPPKPLILFGNDCGETLPAYGIARVTSRVAASGSNPAYHVVAKVDATYRWQYFVNGPVDITNQLFGWGSFLTGDDDEVLYDTGATPAVGQRWGPKSGEFKLFQHRPGFHITGGTAGSGATARVGAQQIPPGEVRLKNDDGGGALAANASRTFGLYGGPAGTTDTGLEVTHTNGSNRSWATDKYGWATFDAGGVIFGAQHQ